METMKDSSYGPSKWEASLASFVASIIVSGFRFLFAVFRFVFNTLAKLV